MVDIYRVVASENQKLYPDKVFVDFMPAGTNRSENAIIHDSILKMRQTINPEVDAITSGLLLYDLGDGNVQLKFEKVYNYNLKRQQDYIREKYEKLIIQRFKDMRQEGKEKTLDISFSDMAVIYDFYSEDKRNFDSPKSAREMELRRKAEEYRQQQIKRKQMIEENANPNRPENKYDVSKYMAWRAAHINGD